MQMLRTPLTVFVFSALFLAKGLFAQPLGETSWAVIEIQDSKFFSGNILDEPHSYTIQGDTVLNIKLNRGPIYEIRPIQHFSTPKIELSEQGIRILHSNETITGAILHFQIVRKRFLSKKMMDVKVEGLTISSLLEVEFEATELHHDFFEGHDEIDFQYSFAPEYLVHDENANRFNITEAVNGLYEPNWTITPAKMHKDRRALQKRIDEQHGQLYGIANGVMEKVFGREIFTESVSRVSASSDANVQIGFMRNDTLATSAYFTYKYVNEKAKASYFVKFGVDHSGRLFYKPNPILNYTLSTKDFEWVPIKQIEDSMLAFFPKVMLVPKTTRRKTKMVKNSDVDITAIFSENLPENLETKNSEQALENEWRPKFLYTVQDKSKNGKTKAVRIWYFDALSAEYLGYVKNRN